MEFSDSLLGRRTSAALAGELYRILCKAVANWSTTGGASVPPAGAAVGLAPANEVTELLALALADRGFACVVFDRDPGRPFFREIRGYDELGGMACAAWWVISPAHEEAVIATLAQHRIPPSLLFTDVSAGDGEIVLPQGGGEEDEAAEEARWAMVALLMELDLNRAADSLLRTARWSARHAGELLWRRGVCSARRGALSAAVSDLDQWALASADSGIDVPGDGTGASVHPGRPMIMASVMKSASEFVRSFLSRATGAPLAHVDIGVHPDNRLVEGLLANAMRGGAIARSHFGPTPHNLRVIRKLGVEKVLVQVRDPRQVVISWVHHVQRIEFGEYRFDRALYHPEIPSDFRRRALSERLDWTIDNVYPGIVEVLEGWRGVADNPPDDLRLLLVPFESFVTDVPAHLMRIAEFFGVDPVAAAEAAGRMAEDPGRNMRKGMVAEWRSVCDEAQRARMGRLLSAPLMAYYGWER